MRGRAIGGPVCCGLNCCLDNASRLGPTHCNPQLQSLAQRPFHRLPSLYDRLLHLAPSALSLPCPPDARRPTPLSSTHGLRKLQPWVHKGSRPLTRDASSIYTAAEGCHQPVHELHPDGPQRRRSGAQEQRLGCTDSCECVSTFVFFLK
jgi:hypothetical protein